MTRLFLAAALCVATAAPALAQLPQECVPNLDTILFGPAPVEYPRPLLPPTPQTRVAARPSGLLFRAARGASADPVAGPPAGGCPTEIRRQPWTGSAWGTDYQRTVSTYDAAGRTLSTTDRVDVGAGLEDDYRATYTYDAAGTPAEILIEAVPEGAPGFQPSSRERYVTNVAGQIVSLTADQWDGAAWQTFVRVTIAYAGGPYATSFLTEEAAGDAFVPSYRGTLTYTSAGARLVSTYESRTGGVWSIDQRDAWAYTDGRAASLVSEQTNGAGGLVAQRSLFTYTGARIATYLYQDTDGAGAWADQARTSFTYDGSGRLTRELTEFAGKSGPLENTSQTTYTQAPTGLAVTDRDFWDGGAWAPSDRLLDTRAANGGLTERIYQGWDGVADWANVTRSQYRYDGTTAGDGGPAATLRMLSAPRPNPARTTAQAAFTLGAAGPARLAILDLLGREVATAFDGPAAAGETTVSIDVAALPAGVYVLRLSAGPQTATQRLAVVR